MAKVTTINLLEGDLSTLVMIGAGVTARIGRRVSAVELMKHVTQMVSVDKIVASITREEQNKVAA